jgi:hypothetical protein
VDLRCFCCTTLMDVILVRRCFISVMSTTCILHMQWYVGSPHTASIGEDGQATHSLSLLDSYLMRRAVNQHPPPTTLQGAQLPGRQRALELDVVGTVATTIVGVATYYFLFCYFDVLEMLRCCNRSLFLATNALLFCTIETFFCYNRSVVSLIRGTS